jgi:hypothetical protein
MCVMFRASAAEQAGDSVRAPQEIREFIEYHLAGVGRDALSASRAAVHAQTLDRTIVGPCLAEVSTTRSRLSTPPAGWRWCPPDDAPSR